MLSVLVEGTRSVDRVDRRREVLTVLTEEERSVDRVVRRREVLIMLTKTTHDGRDVDSSRWIQCVHKDYAILVP